MTTESSMAGGDALHLLSRSRELAQRVRSAQRFTWVPLLVFAAVSYAAIPVERFGHVSTTCRTGSHGGRLCMIYTNSAFVYWPISLVVAYIVIAAAYERRSRSRGLGSRARPFALAGIVLAVLVSAASLWVAHHPPQPTLGGLGPHAQQLYQRLLSPASAIGLALLVLARVERSRALAAVSAGYLVLVLFGIDFGWQVTRASQWVFLPHLVINATVLLLAGIGFAMTQRPWHGSR